MQKVQFECPRNFNNILSRGNRSVTSFSLAPRWAHFWSVTGFVHCHPASRRRPLMSDLSLAAVFEFGGSDCNLNGPKRRLGLLLLLLQLYHVAAGGIPRSVPVAVVDDAAAAPTAPFSVRASEASILLQAARRLIKGSVMRTRKKIHSKIDQPRSPY